MSIISLSELKTFLGISGTSEDDLLQIYVDSANTFVSDFCDRVFEDTTYTEELYDGPGYPTLQLNNYPIISITEILQSGDEIEERTDVGEDGYYIRDMDTGIINYDEVWDRGRGIIQVTYRAGYSDEDMPKDLKHATYIIAAYFRNLGKRAGIRSESLGAYAYSLAMEPQGGKLMIPDIYVQMVLGKYRKKIPNITY